MKTLIRRIVAALAMTGAVLALAPTAIASANGGTDPIAVATGSHLTVTAPVLSIVTGLVMPIVLAVFTKLATSSFRKGIIGIVAAFLAALIERAMLADGSAVFTQALLLDVGLIYGPQLLTYLGLWQKFGTDGLNAKLALRKGVASP